MHVLFCFPFILYVSLIVVLCFIMNSAYITFHVIWSNKAY